MGEDRHGGPRIEELVHRLEAAGDPSTQAAARDLVQALLDLHAAGLARLLEMLREAGEPGARLIARCARDPDVNRLLLLHEMHPEDAATRVRRAVDDLRDVLRAQRVSVDAVHVDAAAAVRVRVSAEGGAGAPPSVARLIEDAVYDAAPEAAAVVVDGLAETPLAFVPLDALRRAKGDGAAART